MIFQNGPGHVQIRRLESQQSYWEDIIVDIGIEFHQNNMIDHIGVSFVFTSTGNVATYKFRRNPEGISKFNVVYLG
jgi:hypothetical protein